MNSLRSKLVTAAAVVAVGVSSAAIATAASSGTASTTTSTPTTSTGVAPGQRDPSQGGHTFNGETETLLTGDVAAKVRAAALAKVPGTVDRVETNADTTVPYEAHIVKADGEEVTVEVNSDYTVAAVSTIRGH